MNGGIPGWFITPHLIALLEQRWQQQSVVSVGYLIQFRKLFLSTVLMRLEPGFRFRQASAYSTTLLQRVCQASAYSTTLWQRVWQASAYHTTLLPRVCQASAYSTTLLPRVCQAALTKLRGREGGAGAERAILPSAGHLQLISTLTIGADFCRLCQYTLPNLTLPNLTYPSPEE